MRPSRTRLPHEIPYWVKDGALYFISINCIDRGRNILCHDFVARGIYESLEFRHHHNEWWIRNFVLMPDHCHGIISFSRHVEMRKSIFNWKRYTARQLGFRWQRDFFDHRIRDTHSLEEKEHYLTMNRVRKQLCASASDWPYLWNAANFE